MPTSTVEAKFPGHFPLSPCPSHSPPLLAKDSVYEAATPDTESDIHIPGTYPRSPEKSPELLRQIKSSTHMLGGTMDGSSDNPKRQAMQRSPSGKEKNIISTEDQASAVKGEDEINRFMNASLECEVNNPGNTANLTSNSEVNLEKDFNGQVGSEDPHPPSRIDVQSNSPAPELPPRSPFRIGSRTWKDDVYSNAQDKAIGCCSEKDTLTAQHQSVINTSPAHANIKKDSGLSVAKEPAGTSQSEPFNIDDKMAENNKLEGARDMVSALFEPMNNVHHGREGGDDRVSSGDLAAQGDVGHGRDAEKPEQGKPKAASLISKMKKTLSKAGRHDS